GIRDFHVTGVQTCALPICLTSTAAVVPVRLIRGDAGVPVTTTVASQWRANVWVCLAGSHVAAHRAETARAAFLRASAALVVRLRSEERRVGNVCRCGWARG